ncbi:lysophospholipid acyltransferase family protein [uncultured Paracoccus sp.]|uniref:lysophospholipid acyltransferase family protein n=1 Tax=uncultured Paracoccus sp. TaxID=189685 RepID=UPI002619C587|nr:lysophospholipid acyltransferase family protein [uncultured Paracoccus sp.]
MTGLASWAITTFARLLTAVQPEWAGIDPTARRRRIYFANHVSHGDFVLIWSVLPPRARRRTRPVAGADYWRKGGLREFIGTDVFNSLLIERNREGAEDDPIAQMAAALDAGDSLIIFPEGTRNLTDAELLEFRSGIYRLALARPEVDLVPVWIENLNRVLPKGAVIPVPLMCKVIFGAPLRTSYGEGKDAFLSRARDALLALNPKQEG